MMMAIQVDRLEGTAEAQHIGDDVDEQAELA